jgi:thermostable 8-oxoguanine DNA glycosylase
MDKTIAKNILVVCVKKLATEKREELERLKEGYSGLARPDFVWHYLLQSFATMGGVAGWRGLIGNEDNYRLVTYETLDKLTPQIRKAQVKETCKAAKIRMPAKKAKYILECFDYVKDKLNGPKNAKALLLSQTGRENKIAFLQKFPGIGPKYARNIMMDVYHEDFRDSIALDVRIKGISEILGLSFKSYLEQEEFYLSVAHEGGLNGWELDRLLFNFFKPHHIYEELQRVAEELRTTVAQLQMKIEEMESNRNPS